MLTETQRQAAVDAILEAERSRVPCVQPSKQWPDMELEDAYDVQRRWAEARIAAGAKIVGRKIGLTSRAMQMASKMTEPDYGVILDDQLYKDGAQIAAGTFIKPRLETELAFVMGDDLSGEGFPMIHAVGRASSRAPRLLDMRWGTDGPALTLVGKGVCFDTGGLDLKPASSMGLMKKDMGGAATVMGLARTIMALGLRIRLRVLVPAVENAVGGNAFRPQDVLTSRKGLTVEINNTDAEGRLVLADALALADEERPDLVISVATLTGAARVAVGPDLAPFYCDDDGVAAALAVLAALLLLVAHRGIAQVLAVCGGLAFVLWHLGLMA